ncbi:hypothetical protein ABT189_15170, partial [Streptomyces sp900105755]
AVVTARGGGDGAAPGATARVAGDDGLVSLVVGERALPRAAVATSADSNALGSPSATPFAETEGPVPHGTLHIALIHLGGTDPAALPEVTARAEGSTLLAEVTWPDGTRDTLLLPHPDHGTRKDQHRA